MESSLVRALVGKRAGPRPFQSVASSAVCLHRFLKSAFYKGAPQRISLSTSRFPNTFHRETWSSFIKVRRPQDPKRASKEVSAHTSPLTPSNILLILITDLQKRLTRPLFLAETRSHYVKYLIILPICRFRPDTSDRI